MIKLFEEFNKDINIIIDIKNTTKTDILYLFEQIKKYNNPHLTIDLISDKDHNKVNEIIKDNNTWGLFLTITINNIFISYITIREWGEGYDKITLKEFLRLETFDNLLNYLENKKKTKKYNI